MKSADGKSRSAQLWISRAERGPALTVDYGSGQRDWLQHIISDADKNKDFKKKDQFLSRLRDFDATRPDAHIYGDF